MSGDHRDVREVLKWTDADQPEPAPRPTEAPVVPKPLVPAAAGPKRIAGSLGALLNAAEVFIRRFVVIDEPQATALTLWVAHTWAIDAPHATPYLFATSAEPECGKTRALEVLSELARASLFTMNISDAALFRTIDKRHPTLFFDEVDSIFNPKARERGHRDELRALLNAGYRRGQIVMRMGGGNNTELQSFEVFGAKALGGLGRLPATLSSRCIRIELKRRRLDEPVEDYYPDELAEEAAQLRAELQAWAESALEALTASRPARIEGLRDRTVEVWRPLLAIAELGGEPWAARARRAALALATGDTDDEATTGTLLMEDIRTVFAEKGDADRIATADLILALAGFSESPWGEWWLDPKGDLPVRGAARRLAQLLRPYGIRTNHTVRAGKRVAKGYRREDFVDAWERFLPPRVEGLHRLHQLQPAPPGDSDVTDVTDVTDRRGGKEEP